jgi:hypothetical protein
LGGLKAPVWDFVENPKNQKQINSKYFKAVQTHSQPNPTTLIGEKMF